MESRNLLIITSHKDKIEIGLTHDKNPELSLIIQPEEIRTKVLEKGLYMYLHHNKNAIPEDTNVLYTEDILFSLKERKQVYLLIITRLGFKSLDFIPNPLIHCFGKQIRTGIIIDVESDCIIATPVCDYSIFDENIQISSRHLPQQEETDGIDVMYRYIYNDEVEYDPNDVSVLTLIKQTLRKSPIDLRKEMSNHILINGGDNTMVAKFISDHHDAFNVHTDITQSFWDSVVLYGKQFIKHKYSENDSFHFEENTSLTHRHILISSDWYQSNFKPLDY